MERKIRRLLVSGVLLVAVALGAFAYGGGGVFEGTQIVQPGYSNLSMTAEVNGGYGYGVSRGGTRHGGFGLLLSDDETEAFLGAFGGVISGHQYRTGPFTLSGNVYSGVGYASPALLPADPGAAFLVEANVEAGLAVLPWMQISVYGGYQAIGSFDPAILFTATRYSPVVGGRVTWGSF